MAPAIASPILGSKPYSKVNVGVSITPSRVMNSCTRMDPMMSPPEATRGPAGPLFEKVTNDPPQNRHRPAPAALLAHLRSREVPVVRGDQLVDALRAPRAALVRQALRRVVQQRLGDLPDPLDAIRAGEQRLVAEHGQQDQPLVPLKGVGLGE